MSMKNKPMPLVVFAVLQLMAPLFTLVFNAYLTKMGLSDYTKAFVSSSSWPELAETFLFFPLAGLCILEMKAWSYPVYLAVALWTMVINGFVWSFAYDHSMGVLIASNAMHFLGLAYYLHPKVRRSFVDQSVKWWETSPRYLANIHHALINNDLRKDCEVVNISEGGALLRTDWEPSHGETIYLKFEFENQMFTTDAAVVHIKEGAFGVQFLTVENRLRKTIRNAGLSPFRQKDTFFAQMIDWVGQLKQGQGLLPQIP